MNSTSSKVGNRNNEGNIKREKSASFEVEGETALHIYSTQFSDSQDSCMLGKRRKSNENETDGDSTAAVLEKDASDTTDSTTVSVGAPTTNIIARDEYSDREAVELPDPDAADIGPDEYLLKLVQALYGLSLSHKGARSLDNFFQVVTEEQRAAYTMNVVTAVRKNNLEELKKIHLEEGQRIDCFNGFGESLLHMACRRGFEDIVCYLLDQPNISVRISDDNGRTPMHDACWHPNPQLKICKWIIERDPTLFLISDNRGYTPFQYARPQHWSTWRKFLYENRDCLRALTESENVSRLVVVNGES